MSLSQFTARRRFLLAAAALCFAVLAAWTASAVVPPNLPRALDAQRARAARYPADAGAQVDLGNLLLLGGQTDAAEAAYRRALEIEPDDAAAHFNLGLLLQQRGETSRAWREYRRTLESDPRHAWAYYQIGTIEAGRGFESLAVRSYAHAFALDPRLRFPDVNPHVIDNPLTTRAMLAAYRLNLTNAPPSPDYDDPLRIAGLLVPGLRPDAGDDDAPEAAPAVAEAPAVRDVDSEVAAAAVRMKQRVPNPTPGARAELEPAEPEEASEPAFTRTIGAGDLNPTSRSGQVVGQSGQTGRSGSTTGYRQQPPPVYQPAPADDGGEDEETPPPSVPGFRPGVPSTGRLDMKLVPERLRADDRA